MNKKHIVISEELHQRLSVFKAVNSLVTFEEAINELLDLNE